MHTDRIGSLLVDRGILTEGQVQQVLGQQVVDERPFGAIAASLFAIPLRDIAVALAEQIMMDCPYVNLVQETLDDDALGLITAKDAWDNLVLPLRIDDGTLVCATTDETLASAIELVQSNIPMPFRFVIADIRLLEQFIAEKYHFEGVEVEEPASTRLAS